MHQQSQTPHCSYMTVLMDFHCCTTATTRSLTIWVQIVAILFYGMLYTTPASCQPGFVSIDCGSNENYTDSTGIEWTTDELYVSTGRSYTSIYTGGNDMSQLNSLRYFVGKGRTRDCYVLPTEPGRPYLIRPKFAYGDLRRFLKASDPTVSNFTVYVNGMRWFHYSSCADTASESGYTWYEGIVYSRDKAISVCLVRAEDGSSFMSSLELRRLENGMYSEVRPPPNNRKEQLLLGLIRRYNFGPSQSNLRYPDDKFDRIWSFTSVEDNAMQLHNRTTLNSADVAEAPNLPPLGVMEDAITYGPSYPGIWWWHRFDYPVESLVAISYIQQLDGNGSVHGMDYYINGKYIKPFNISDNATQVDGTLNMRAEEINATILPASWSKMSPIWNALEYYELQRHNITQTAEVDWLALSALQSKFNVTDWDKGLNGDPCVPAPYGWINCMPDSANQSQQRVVGLFLNGRGLSRPIPDELFKLTKLTNLSLEDNRLNGSFPNFQGLANLQSISLHNNKLEGTIDGLSMLTSLRYVNLKNNSLSGDIPDFFANFPNLTELHLDGNNFSGNVPAALTSKKGLMFTYSDNPVKHSSSSNVKAIVGGLIGGIIGLIIFLVLVWYFVTRDKRVKARILKELRSKGEWGKGEVASFGSLRVFTLEQVSQATKKFSRKIGQGGYGGVYYGTLPKGEEVAAKVGAGKSGHGGEEFQNELELLSRIHHANLVSLVGYCSQEGQEILIYAYVPNGTLRDHLDYRETSNAPLSWKTRLNIAVNSATGLEYLHFYCKPRIIHRDVKSSNILLDRNMVAKVADFGISKQTPDGTATGVQTVLKGTLGYIDPEYFSTQILTTKSDVYSFGVLLLEIISGHYPLPRQYDEGAIVNLVGWARICAEDGNDREFFDPSMGNKLEYQSVRMVLDLAMECTNPISKYRPDMQHVLRRLVDAAQLEEEQFRASSAHLEEQHFRASQRTNEEEEDAEDFGSMISPGF